MTPIELRNYRKKLSSIHASGGGKKYSLKNVLHSYWDAR